MLQNTVIYVTFFNNNGQGHKWITAKRQLYTIKIVLENGF